MVNKDLNLRLGEVDVATVLPKTVANLSSFDLSETLKTTIKPDGLYPVYHRELMPNDHFVVRVKSLARILSMVAPSMDPIKLKLFAFWVPNRLLWTHWLNFMGEKTYQGDRIDYKVPQINMKDTSNLPKGLADYLGIVPTKDIIDYSVNAFPFRAYNKIWNEWFRSNKLQEEAKEYSDDEEKNLSEYKILKKGKPMDYFTECLPVPITQDVEIGLVGNAPVTGKSTLSGLNEYSIMLDNGDNRRLDTNAGSGQNRLFYSSVNGNDNSLLYADMSKVSGVSVEALRHASALQVLLEKDNRAGELYVDLMNIHFGVDIPDFLVGRSEYLGSTTTYINTEPVLTSTVTETSPLGEMGAVGFGVQDDLLCDFSAREHGQFMILACVATDPIYQQGLDRKWSRTERFDYPFPEFFNLGEQPVLEKEIFLSATNAKSNKVFGYCPRYQEERRGVNRTSGLMRSGVEGSLDVWHLGQKFENAPGLNGEFIESKTPLDRVVAVTGEDNILLNIMFNVQADRCLPVSSNPSIVAGRV